MIISHIRVEEPRLLLEITYDEGHLLFMALMSYCEERESSDLAEQIDEALSELDEADEPTTGDAAG